MRRFFVATLMITALLCISDARSECQPTASYTAVGQGYYVVVVDGADVSNHTTEREALERATNEAFGNQAASVVLEHRYSVTVEVDTSSCTAPVDGTTLSWQAPTTRTDGSPLLTTNIANFRVYYGESTDDLQILTDVPGSITEFTINDAPPGYFAMTTVDTEGLESPFSNVVSKGL